MYDNSKVAIDAYDSLVNLFPNQPYNFYVECAFQALNAANIPRDAHNETSSNS